MARPQFIQQLKHDRLLTKKDFPQFVDTWNYVAKRIDNIKGDCDADPLNGCINVDNTDPEHPVIRLNRNNLPTGGDVTVDSDLPPIELSSIQTRTDQDGVDYQQLFGFDQPAIEYSDISSQLSDVELVIREGVTLSSGSRINYFPIQQLSNVISCGGNYWESGGDSSTCYADEIKVGNVLIYETTV